MNALAKIETRRACLENAIQDGSKLRFMFTNNAEPPFSDIKIVLYKAWLTTVAWDLGPRQARAFKGFFKPPSNSSCIQAEDFVRCLDDQIQTLKASWA
jgi:hypothetical protein